MLYRVLADVAVLVHFLWIVFLFIGAVWGRKHRSVAILHCAGLVFALVLHVFGWYCPLTHLEVWFRAKHDPLLAYPGSFVIHYLEGLIYIRLSARILLGFTIVLCGFNAWLYLARYGPWFMRIARRSK